MVCSNATIKNAQQTVEDSIDICKERYKDGFDIKKDLKLVSFDSIEGVKNLTTLLKNVDGRDAPPPVKMKKIDQNGERCLILWDEKYE